MLCCNHWLWGEGGRENMAPGSRDPRVRGQAEGPARMACRALEASLQPQVTPLGDGGSRSVV